MLKEEKTLPGLGVLKLTLQESESVQYEIDHWKKTRTCFWNDYHIDDRQCIGDLH